MAFLQGQLHDVFAAKPVETVGQLGDPGVMIFVAPVESGLCRREFLACGGGQRDGIDAECSSDPVEFE